MIFRNVRIFLAGTAVFLILAGVLPENAWAGARRETMVQRPAVSASIPADSFPASYDMRTEKLLFPVPDQGNTGLCWAYASLAAVESSMPDALRVPLSSAHLGKTSGFLEKTEGGDCTMAAAYLLAWQGPVAEGTEDGPACHVQEIRLLPDKDYDAVKQAVLAYGGVQSSLFLSGEELARMKMGKGKEFCIREPHVPNHDVVIVGWDDSYPKERFLDSPNHDGAFLCRNSWGETFGDGGYFYVSYEDGTIGTNLVSYSKIENPDNYRCLYQTDLCGWTGQTGYGTGRAWFSNTFTACEDGTLAAAGFYATVPNTSCRFYVKAWEPDEEESLEPGMLVAEVQEDYAGFYTVPFVCPVKVKQGQRFSVTAAIDSPGTKQPVAVEYAGEGRLGAVDISDGEGYISFDGKSWERTEKEGFNVCLKVYGH